MSRNKTLFIYNDTRADQEWTIYSEGVINQSYTLGQDRKSFTVTLSANAVIKFGVDDAVYLDAIYDYRSDSWTSRTATPNEMQFSAAQSAVSVTCSYVP
ncbi:MULTISPECIES: hypothetical protein [Lysobacter]|uniref:hypothetical protein n=1 Tax=Lysobacter TaxID=68 RepID=UPI0004D0271E|nr:MULTISPECIES: hypothetical protein [Lysobacter]